MYLIRSQPFEFCRREAEAARKEAAAAGAEAERLAGELREVRCAVAQRRAERSAQSSQSAIIQALMAARKDIPGIRGRLGAPHIFALTELHHAVLVLGTVLHSISTSANEASLHA